MAPPTSTSTTTPRRTLRALLVGIDAYRDPVPPLRGCVADVERVARILEQRASATGDRLEITLLRDDEATRDAVVHAFRSSLAGGGPVDTALFYYSGHGSQERPAPGAAGWEPDALDETLVLVDSRDPGRHDLADTELGRLVAEVGDVAGHVLVVLDCCHSGSGVRAPDASTRVRQAPRDERPRPADSYLGPPPGATGQRGAAGVGGAARLHRPTGVGDRPPAPGETPGPGSHPGDAPARPGGRYVLLAACRSDQTAKEVRIDGVTRGAFSSALESALAVSAHADYLTLQRSVAAAVRNLAADQSPVLEASVPQDARLPFLGGVASPAHPLLTASYVTRQGWVLDAGRLHGLAADGDVPTTVDLHPLLAPGDGTPRVAASPGTASPGTALTGTALTGTAPIGTARVVQVRAASSVLTPVGNPPLRREQTYRAVITSAPQPQVVVSVTGTGAAVDTARSRLRASTVVRLADEPTDGPAEAPPGDLVLRAEGGRLTLTRPGVADPLTADEDASDPGAVDRVVAACEHIGRWLGILRRQNPGAALNDLVDLTVRAPGGGALPESGGRIEVAYTGPGDDDTPVIAVSYGNRSGGPLHCAVLVLTERYGVECLTTGGSVLLGPGETAWVTDEAGRPQLRTTVPDGQRRTTDVLKLLVSGEAFDAQSMNQAELEPVSPAPGPAVGGDRGITRRTALPTGADWATREVLVSTSRHPGTVDTPGAAGV